MTRLLALGVAFPAMGIGMLIAVVGYGCVTLGSWVTERAYGVIRRWRAPDGGDE